MNGKRFIVVASCAVQLSACGSVDPTKSVVPMGSAPPGPTGPVPYSAWPGFCARGGEDAVTDIFCGEEPATLRSLHELESRLSLDYSAEAADTSGYDSDAVYRSVVLLGHSTALSGRLVSPINPRVIVIGINSMLAFNRGTQQVEIVSRDRKTISFNFYLLSFEQACNATRDGCRPGD